MAKKEGKSTQPMELNFNLNLSTNWVDTINIGIREDNMFLVRFLTNLPEGIFEQSRVMTSKEHMMKFVDLFCSTLDYYPKKTKI
jgi:hypothetical protein